jgi:chorismate mutase
MGNQVEHAAVRLDESRAELDRVDARILDAMSARFRIIEAVGRLKQTAGIPMMQPDRVAFVQRRARDHAEATGMSRDFLATLYALIVQEACRVEDAIIDGTGGAES